MVWWSWNLEEDEGEIREEVEAGCGGKDCTTRVC
jgi:hypothetical protein